MKILTNILSVACWLAAVLLLVGGIAKLSDVETFRVALESWVIFPKAAVPALAAAVPVLELVCAVYFIRARGSIGGLLAVGGVYLALTLAIIGESCFHEPPKCGCLGPLQIYAEHIALLRGSIVRNLIVLATVAVSAYLKYQGAAEVRKLRGGVRCVAIEQ